MKKNILVLAAVLAVVLCSCKQEWGYYYYLQNDLTDSLTIIELTYYDGHSGAFLAANEYCPLRFFSGNGHKTTYYDVPEKYEAILFTYKGKTYREDRRGGYSALNSAVYGKPTHPNLQRVFNYCFVFNITEEYLATLPEVTE